MATFDSWESYFYPETYNPITQDGTLRNLYGERDAATLHDLEYGAADRRSVELRLGVADAPWVELGRDQFAHAAADIFSRCNFAHSAREGNGRTVKLFMQGP